MNRLLAFLLVILLLIAMDFYVFQGFKFFIKRWVPSQQSLMNYLYWLVPLGLILLLFVMGFAGKTMNNSLVSRFIFSLVIMFYLAKMAWFIFIAVDDIVRLGRFLKGASDIPNEAMMAKINRSTFIVSAGALVAGSLMGGLIYGIVRGAHHYQVLKRTLKIPALPSAFEGLKIVQISDIHSGSFWSKDSVARGIELIKDQGADIIFFTGDLVNNEAKEFEEYKSLFSKIQAPMGVYSILGNHDYGDYVSWPNKEGLSKEENLNKLKAHQKEIGWKLLANEHHLLEKEGARMAVIGVENWGDRGFSQYGDLDKAYNGSEEADVKMLLSHDPSHWRAQVLEKYKDIVATFSGHTHGMQFGVDSKYFKWSPVQYRYKEWADLYEEAGQYLYVNRGFGYLGYPGRLGFRPEITVFELESA